MTLSQPHTFGHHPRYGEVRRIQIANGGARASIMTWGASLQDFRLDGIAHSLALGSDHFEDYLEPLRYFGAIVGPVANRIANGSARVSGQQLSFDRNENGETTLHGGFEGCGQRNWSIEAYDAQSCRLGLVFPAGGGGFPGPLSLSAEYAIDASGRLRIALSGTSEVAALCNLAFHGYWNLSGAPDIRSHDLWVNAAQYLPVDDRLIPLGAPRDVAADGFDFREMRKLDSPGIPALDHNFCLDGSGLRAACRLGAGGLTLEIQTDAPGLQIYDGAGLGSGHGPSHANFGKHAGIAIEPQHWPDAPNQQGYPSIRLDPGETYRQTSVFSFERH